MVDRIRYPTVSYLPFSKQIISSDTPPQNYFQKLGTTHITVQYLRIVRGSEISLVCLLSYLSPLSSQNQTKSSQEGSTRVMTEATRPCLEFVCLPSRTPMCEIHRRFVVEHQVKDVTLASTEKKKKRLKRLSEVIIKLLDSGALCSVFKNNDM